MIAEAINRLWTMSRQAGILILIVLTVRVCLKKYPRIYSYCLWVLVGIKLLCPIRIESPFSLYVSDMPSVSFVWQTQDSLNHAAAQSAFLNEAPTDMSEEKILTDISGTEPSIKKGTGLQKNQIYLALYVIYCCGAAGFILFYLIQYLLIRKRLSSAIRDKDGVWLSDQIASPFVIGVICPKIYLPYHIDKQSKKHILRHEKMHIRHHDPFIRIIATLCLCLHWWNPFVWIGVYCMNQDMEMFCDESVLRYAPLEERKAYAKTLLSFAEKNSQIGIGLAFVGESHTEKRIKNIMRKQKRSWLIICLLAALSIFCTAALLTVPQTEKDSSNIENNEAIESSIALSTQDLSYLKKICQSIPDFSTETEMDIDFWKDYLFYTYTSDFEREEVIRYSEQYGFDIPYVKADYEEVNETIVQLFGKRLEEYGMTPESLSQGDGNLIYENGSFLIAASDSPLYDFTEENITQAGSMTDVLLIKTIEDGEQVSRVMLHLLPAANARGFVVNGKKETPIPATLSNIDMIEESYDIEMTPYGNVTFAVYHPDLSISPYADVTYKLLQNGAEIYSFPLQGTGVREDGSVFVEMTAVAFPDLNQDGYADVVTIAYYEHEGEPIPPQARIFTYNAGGYFLEESYLEAAFNESHETKTVAEIENFATQPENQDYYIHTSMKE